MANLLKMAIIVMSDNYTSRPTTTRFPDPI